MQKLSELIVDGRCVAKWLWMSYSGLAKPANPSGGVFAVVGLLSTFNRWGNMQYVLNVGRVNGQGCLGSSEWVSFLGFAKARAWDVVVCSNQCVDRFREIFAGLAQVQFQKIIDADLRVSSIKLTPISDGFWPRFQKLRCDDVGIYEIVYFFESEQLAAEVQIEDGENFLIIQEGAWLGLMLSWMQMTTCLPSESYPHREEISEKVEGGLWRLITEFGALGRS